MWAFVLLPTIILFIFLTVTENTKSKGSDTSKYGSGKSTGNLSFQPTKRIRRK